jgi:hypothetical protein
MVFKKMIFFHLIQRNFELRSKNPCRRANSIRPIFGSFGVDEKNLKKTYGICVQKSRKILKSHVRAPHSTYLRK